MRSDIRAILGQAAAVPDDAVDIAEVALALAAADRATVDLAPYRRHLDQLSGAVAAMPDPAADATARAAALREVLAVRYGYVGDVDTYDDLQNANLIRVIDRRKGLPVALAILYMHTARALAWEVTGLSFPGHFLLRLDCGAQRVIVDPFHGGMVRTTADMRDLLKVMLGAEAELTADHYAPVSNRAVLLRLQNNLKLRHLRAGQAAQALAALETMRLLAPEDPLLIREAALLQARAGQVGAAIGSLEDFIDSGTGVGLDQRLLHEAALLLQQLRSRLN